MQQNQMSGHRIVGIECLDKASELAKQIHAMVCMTFGGAGDSFRAMSDDIQDGFMWAMESKIEEMKFLITSMEESRAATNPGAGVSFPKVEG